LIETIGVTGLTLGLLGSLIANHLLLALLYEVSPTDGMTLVLAVLLLLCVACLARAIPAPWSMRLEPIVALRID
jgi:hypothetical protein